MLTTEEAAVVAGRIYTVMAGPEEGVEAISSANMSAGIWRLQTVLRTLAAGLALATVGHTTEIRQRQAERES